MTWSIVARDKVTGAFGIAVASRAFAVGAICPHLSAGAGAVCTQSLTNPYLGIRGVALLDTGLPAPDAVAAIIAGDEGRAVRQLHAIDRQGRNSAYTGADCIDWAGHRIADDVSVAGNMLSGPTVVEATLSTYLEYLDRPLAERLLRAMNAGEQAGGDKRGRQSAALKVVSSEDFADLDIRADDHPDPLGELWRLYQVAHERFLPRLPFMSTRANPAGLLGFEELDAAIARQIETQPIPDFSEFWRREP